MTASVGTRLRETEAVVSTNEDLDLNYQAQAFGARRSRLRPRDQRPQFPANCISRPSQKSFMLITGLSLFKLL
jgi:hypothetical protein